MVINSPQLACEFEPDQIEQESSHVRARIGKAESQFTASWKFAATFFHGFTWPACDRVL